MAYPRGSELVAELMRNNEAAGGTFGGNEQVVESRDGGWIVDLNGNRSLVVDNAPG